MRRNAFHENLETRHTLAPRDDFSAIACGLSHQHIFCLASLRLDQPPRRRAADLFVGDVELRHSQRRAFIVRAKLPERVVGEIGSAFHVVDARTERAVALYSKRQPLDKSHRVHGIEMAEDEDTRRILAP